MDVFRDVLLWASTNRTLADRLPRMPFVRATVQRFMPGETPDDALEAAATLAERGVSAAFTHLGENVADERQATAVTEHYLGLLDRIAERRLDAEISVKLTHLGLDLAPSVALGNVRRLAAGATDRRTRVWLDMEASGYVDATLEAYRALVADHPDSGICLQAYLHRTPQDVANLLPLHPSIRFVKGAYREPAEVALQGKARIAAAYHRLALEVATRGDGAGRLVLGTHDVELVRKVDAELRQRGIGRDAFEIEMLFGIRTADQVALAAEGFRVRSLIAYGPHWYPWFMRRLAERPANVLFALRNLLARRA